MTIAELLARIGLAFARTFDLVMKGVGDVVLSDLGIIAATVFVGLVFFVLGLMVSIRVLLVGIAIAAVVVVAVMLWP